MTIERRSEDIRTGDEEAGHVLTLDDDLHAGWAPPTVPADQLFTVSQEGGANGGLFPVTGVGGDQLSITIAGDHVALFFGVFRITGSTGNDGVWIGLSAYDAGTDTTTITLIDPLPDPTADGSIEAPGFYNFDFPVEAGEAIEWVRVRNTIPWDVLEDFGFGDGGSLFALGNADDPAAIGVWYLRGLSTGNPQGSLTTGDALWGLNAELPDGNMLPAAAVAPPTYPIFTEDTTVRVTIGVFDDASATGVSEVIVHIHRWEAQDVVTTRMPA